MESFNTQSSVVPFDTIPLIIDIVGENKDIDLLKDLALVSHSFLQICNKHLSATTKLHDKYIRKLTYNVSDYAWLGRYAPADVDHILSPILPNSLKTIPHLDYLEIKVAGGWNTLDSSLPSALLHLMHLPTIVTHINLSSIYNFPLSSLTPCVDLHHILSEP